MKETDQGVIIEIKVTPKSRENKIIGFEEGVLKIRLTAAPEKGEANRALIRFLAKALDIPQRDIILLKGETSRQKQLCIHCNIQKIDAIIPVGSNAAKKSLKKDIFS